MPAFEELLEPKQVDWYGHQVKSSELQQFVLDVDEPQCFDYEILQPLGVTISDV